MEQIRFHIFLSISLHTKKTNNQTETKKRKKATCSTLWVAQSLSSGFMQISVRDTIDPE
jgi:hypothetical protein